MQATDKQKHNRSSNGTWLCLTDYSVRFLKQASELIPLRNGQSIKISDTILHVEWGKRADRLTTEQ